MLENSWYKKENPFIGLTGMGGGVGSNLVLFGGVDGDFTPGTKSCRLNGDDSAHLIKTPSSAGDRKTWTFSFWVKLCGSSGHLIAAGNDAFQFEIRSDGQYLIQNTGCFSNTYSGRVFRDYGAFYHFVIEHDATNTYCKIWVNGSLSQTITATDADGSFNNNTAHSINCRSTSIDSFTDFYLADLHFVDGTALDASSFGETVDGSWVPIEYTHSTSDWHTVNDGTNWTSSAVSGVSGWTQALAQGFNGSLSNAAEGNTNGETATIALGQDITISAGGVGVYTWVTSGAPLVFKLKLDGVVKETINQGASGGQWYYSSSYAGDIDSITVARTGRAPEWGAISINGVVLIDGAADNSFHLKFDNTSDLGEDSAGSNDWTANSFSTSAGTGNDVLADSPTAYNDGGNGVGNYATLNPLEKGSDTTLSDGNLKAVSTNGTGWESHCSTLGVSTGKWYFETECVAGSVFSIGITDASNDIRDLYTTDLSPAYAYNYNGKKYSGNVTDGGTVASSFTAGDLIGCAFDLDAGTIRFYKNGVDEGEFYNNVTSNVTYKAAASTRNATVVVNFGQRAFDNLPTGYKALNSYNT